jgi:hypothetical protein
MKNEKFNMLRSIGVFKDWHRSGKASDKTEKRKMERSHGRMVWISRDISILPMTGLQSNRGRGTYIRQKHGVL